MHRGADHSYRIFRIINEDTHQPVVNPAAGADAAVGTVVGLANHTLLISRDRPPDPHRSDSGAPISTRTARYGVCKVFRDQARAGGTKALVESESAASDDPVRKQPHPCGSTTWRRCLSRSESVQRWPHYGYRGRILRCGAEIRPCQKTQDRLTVTSGSNARTACVRRMAAQVKNGDRSSMSRSPSHTLEFAGSPGLVLGQSPKTSRSESALKPPNASSAPWPLSARADDEGAESARCIWMTDECDS